MADEPEATPPPPPSPAPFENPRPAVMAKVQLWVVTMWRMDHPEGTADEAAADLAALLYEAVTTSFA